MIENIKKFWKWILSFLIFLVGSIIYLFKKKEAAEFYENKDKNHKKIIDAEKEANKKLTQAQESSTIKHEAKVAAIEKKYEKKASDLRKKLKEESDMSDEEIGRAIADLLDAEFLEK